MDYNLWYDRLGINNLTICNNVDEYTKLSFIPYRCTLISTLNYLNITNFKINDESNSCFKNIYPIKLGYYKSDTQINIDDIEVFYSKFKNTNCEILFFYPHELFIVDDQNLKLFENIKNRYDIKIKLLSSDIDRNQKLPLYVEHISFNYFFYATSIFEATKKQPILNYKKNASKDFIFLNGRFKPIRALIQYDLIYKEYLKNSTTSFHGYTDSSITYTEEFDQYMLSLDETDRNYIIKNYSIDNFKTWLEEIYPTRKDTSYLKSLFCELASQFNEFYNDTYIEVISETYFDSSSPLFITEKTYRPIAYGMIFLVCGQKNTLAYLKSKGFLTFDNIFDESYDNKDNWSDRWRIIKDNLLLWVRLSNQDKKMYYRNNYDKLVYNQRLLYQFEKINDIKLFLG